MTPEEKALELIHTFEHAKTYGNSSNAMSRELAKQCALICCNEVLGYMGADRGTEFWTSVKQEIEKL
jgi:hypothetical protein